MYTYVLYVHAVNVQVYICCTFEHLYDCVLVDIVVL